MNIPRISIRAMVRVRARARVRITKIRLSFEQYEE